MSGTPTRSLFLKAKDELVAALNEEVSDVDTFEECLDENNRSYNLGERKLGDVINQDITNLLLKYAAKVDDLYMKALSDYDQKYSKGLNFTLINSSLQAVDLNSLKGGRKARKPRAKAQKPKAPKKK